MSFSCHPQPSVACYVFTFTLLPFFIFSTFSCFCVRANVRPRPDVSASSSYLYSIDLGATTASGRGAARRGAVAAVHVVAVRSEGVIGVIFRLGSEMPRDHVSLLRTCP